MTSRFGRSCVALNATAPSFGAAACRRAHESCVFTPAAAAARGGGGGAGGRGLRAAACTGQIHASRLDGFFPGDLKDAGQQEQLVKDVRGILDSERALSFHLCGLS
jgi:hypothetical protein